MADDKARKAHDLAEEAVDKAEAGDVAGAKDLAGQAKKLDRGAAEQVAREVEDDRKQAEGYAGKAER